MPSNRRIRLPDAWLRRCHRLTLARGSSRVHSGCLASIRGLRCRGLAQCEASTRRLPLAVVMLSLLIRLAQNFHAAGMKRGQNTWWYHCGEHICWRRSHRRGAWGLKHRRARRGIPTSSRRVHSRVRRYQRSRDITLCDRGNYTQTLCYSLSASPVNETLRWGKVSWRAAILQLCGTPRNNLGCSNLWLLVLLPRDQNIKIVWVLRRRNNRRRCVAASTGRRTWNS